MMFLQLIPRFVRYPVKRLLNYLTSKHLRLEPIDGTMQNDVFIAGYPKSGNTWLQNIIVELAFDLQADRLSDSLLQELVPDVHFKRYFKRFRDVMIFKTHFLPRREYKRVIYVVRDGRDVAVSYSHYLSALKPGVFRIEDVIAGHRSIFPCSWHHHVECWLANPYDSEMLIVKYEELLENPALHIMRIAKFLNIEIENSRLDELVQRTSFSAMQKKEAESGWDGGRDWPKEKRFVRSGRARGYLQEMTEDQRKYAESMFGGTLVRLGYIE